MILRDRGPQAFNIDTDILNHVDKNAVYFECGKSDDDNSNLFFDTLKFSQKQFTALLRSEE